MGDLKYKFRDIISQKIHQAKTKADLPEECWFKLESNKIADECAKELKELIELYLYLPCCHTSGMHDPTHFEKRGYVCEDQKAEALERFCRDLEINPVVRSKSDCCWCGDFPEKRKGEGLHLFEKKKKVAQ